MSIETRITEKGLLQRICGYTDDPVPHCVARALLDVIDAAIGEAVRFRDELQAAVAINKDYEENLGRMILDPRHIAEVFACDLPGNEGVISLSVARDGKLHWHVDDGICGGGGSTLSEAMADYRARVAKVAS